MLTDICRFLPAFVIICQTSINIPAYFLAISMSSVNFPSQYTANCRNYTTALSFVYTSAPLSRCAVRVQRVSSVWLINLREPKASKGYSVHGGASSSLCVRAKNQQILVHGEWYANRLQTAQRRFAVPSTHTRI